MQEPRCLLVRATDQTSDLAARSRDLRHLALMDQALFADCTSISTATSLWQCSEVPRERNSVDIRSEPHAT